MMTFIYVVAIVAEAMSGALAAGRRNMDIFGVAVIAFVTALGGGTVRDVILGNFPIGWTKHPEYVAVVIAAGLLTTLIAAHMQRPLHLVEFGAGLARRHSLTIDLREEATLLGETSLFGFFRCALTGAEFHRVFLAQGFLAGHSVVQSFA
jgi:hypothetical protein